MRREKYAHLRPILAVLCIGAVYYLFVRLTGWYLPCPFRALTGFACPGCGISHFCTDLLALRPWQAVQQNLALAVLLPIWLCAGLVWLWKKPACLQKNGVALRILTWGSVAALLVFGVLRNLPTFSFLLPLYLR